MLENPNGKRYVGQTNDLERRLVEHNDPKHNPAKFTTKHKGSWRIIYFEKYAARAEAMKREKWLKSGAGRGWLNNKTGRASPPQAD